MRYMLAIAAGVLLLGSTARAEELALTIDSGAADTYENLATDGHYVELSSPTGWSHVFAQELSFYGHRFGDVSGKRGTIIVWTLAPDTSTPTQGSTGRARPRTGLSTALTTKGGVANIILRQQFDLRGVPEQPGWFSIPLEATPLPRTFGVSLFTFSNASGGVNVALSKPVRGSSRSATGIPSLMAEAAPIRFRHDARNWMIRLGIRDSLRPTTEFASSDLMGSRFALHDDGSAEGFATTQRDGPMVRFSSSGRERLRRVHVHGKLTGNWFNTDREAGVWILDSSYGIVWYGKLAYRQYTGEASWGFVEVPDMLAPAQYYVVVEPVSRPNLGFYIGYDTSSPNRGSLFGNAGAPQIWAIDAPEDRTNWMIRVEYR